MFIIGYLREHPSSRSGRSESPNQRVATAVPVVEIQIRQRRKTRHRAKPMVHNLLFSIYGNSVLTQTGSQANGVGASGLYERGNDSQLSQSFQPELDCRCEATAGEFAPRTAAAGQSPRQALHGRYFPLNPI